MRRFFLLLSAVSFSLTIPFSAWGEHSMNMEQAVEQALKENKSINAAYSGAAAAESARKSARGAFGPSLNTGYSATYRQKNLSMGRLTDKHQYTWQVSVDQPLFTGFALLASYQKAALQKEQAEAQRRQTELQIISTVQETFLAHLAAIENVRSAESSLNRLKTQLKVNQQFYETGLKPKLDVLQAETDVASAEDTLLQMQNDFDTTRTRLNTLLNLPLEENVEYVGSLDFIAFKQALPDCLSSAYALRPDIFIARKSVEISYKDKMSAASNFYPQISGTVVSESMGDSWRAAGSKLVPTNFHDWYVGLNATWNIFNWGQTYFATQEASHLISKVKAEEEDLTQQVAYDIKSRLLKIQETAKRIKVASRAVEQGQEAFRMAVARYEAQVGTNLDVLTAQSSLTQAESELTSAKAGYLTTLSGLYAAMGEANPSLAQLAVASKSPKQKIARPENYSPAPDSNWPLVMPWQPSDYKGSTYPLTEGDKKPVTNTPKNYRSGK